MILKILLEKVAAIAKRGVTVIADKGITDIVHHEKRSKKQKDPCIGNPDGNDLIGSAKKSDDRPGNKKTGQGKEQTENKGKKDGVGKIETGFLVASCLVDLETGSRADTDHGADGKDQAVERQDQVQGSNAVCTLRQGNKKSICQYIGGHTDHAQNVLGNVFCKKGSGGSFLADEAEVIKILLLLKFKISAPAASNPYG